jgi:hypothetical protein
MVVFPGGVVMDLGLIHSTGQNTGGAVCMADCPTHLFRLGSGRKRFCQTLLILL